MQTEKHKYQLPIIRNAVKVKMTGHYVPPPKSRTVGKREQQP